MPAKQRRSVVLPDPLGPFKATTCPGITSKDKFSNKTRPPFIWVKFATVRRGSSLMEVSIPNFLDEVNGRLQNKSNLTFLILGIIGSENLLEGANNIILKDLRLNIRGHVLNREFSVRYVN